MARWLLPVLAAALFSLGCPSNDPMIPIEESADAPVALLSSVNVADPRAQAQLLEGFYPLEQDAWRWTAKTFRVILACPAPVAGHQSVLDLLVTIPDASSSLLPLVLSVRVGDVEVGSHTFEAPATSQAVKIPIPDSALAQDAAVVEFQLDKALMPDGPDGPDLGIILVSVAIE